MRVGQSQPLCLRVHQVGKFRNAPAHADGDCRRRIVCGLEQKGIEQLLQGQLLSLRQIDGGALHADRFRRRSDDRFGRGVCQCRQRGHDFCGACHGEPPVGVLFKQDQAVPGIHENGTLRRDGRCTDRLGRHRQTPEQQSGQKQHRQDQSTHDKTSGKTYGFELPSHRDAVCAPLIHVYFSGVRFMSRTVSFRPARRRPPRQTAPAVCRQPPAHG